VIQMQDKFLAPILRLWGPIQHGSPHIRGQYAILHPVACFAGSGSPRHHNRNPRQHNRSCYTSPSLSLSAATSATSLVTAAHCRAVAARQSLGGLLPNRVSADTLTQSSTFPHPPRAFEWLFCAMHKTLWLPTPPRPLCGRLPRHDVMVEQRPTSQPNCPLWLVHGPGPPAQQLW